MYLLIKKSLSDEVIKELCDKVENSLEMFVLEYKGKLFEDGKIIEGGMEEKIKKIYETNLSDFILAKGSNIELISKEQKIYIKNRIKNTLELSKKQYDS